MKNSSFPKTMQQSFSRVDERQKIRLQVEFSITLYILDFFSEEILFQTDWIDALQEWLNLNIIEILWCLCT